MTDRLDVQEFLGGYFAEMDEHIAAASRHLLAIDEDLKRGDTNPRAVRELFRSLHTIKGISAMVGVEPIVDIAHVMETAVRSAERSGGALPAPAVALLIQGLSRITERVQDLSKKRTVRPAPEALIESLTALQWPTAGQQPASALRLELPAGILEKITVAEAAQLTQAAMRGKRVLRLDFVPSPERAAAGVNITTVRQKLAEVADIVKVLPQARPAGPDAPAGLAFVLLLCTEAHDEALAHAAGIQAGDIVSAVSAAAVEEAARAAPGNVVFDEEDALPIQSGYVRVRVERLDDALERLSALVVTRFRLSRAVARLSAQGVKVSELEQIVGENNRQLRDLRAAIMRARMVSVSELLERAPLLVRGMTQTTGKKVELRIEAGHAEIDKGVGERIFPALLHIIRNAVDHAIEPPADRVKLGKTEAGHIVISCHERSSTQLELSISDDGRGIDRQRVAEKAGCPVPQTDEELLAILARPGFSTLQTPTRTSGRGIGMDIVKKVAVDELGGDLELRTTPGTGTTVILRVPLSLTIVEAFSFIAGGQTFVAPVASIEEIVEVDPAHVHAGGGARARFACSRAGAKQCR